MDDKTLLERAAKVYGDDSVKPDQFGDFYRRAGWDETLGCAVLVDWNPLLDDGDAFRLMLALGLFVQRPNSSNVVVWTNSMDADFFEVAVDGDWATATRRAIVRAAAALAKD